MGQAEYVMKDLMNRGRMADLGIQIVMDRDRRLTGFLRGQTDNVNAPAGFELNAPWRVSGLQHTQDDPWTDMSPDRERHFIVMECLSTGNRTKNSIFVSLSLIWSINVELHTARLRACLCQVQFLSGTHSRLFTQFAQRVGIQPEE
jgi:hypothetical protein